VPLYWTAADFGGYTRGHDSQQSAETATQTASMVGNEIDYEQRIELTPALRPTAAYASFRELIGQISGLEAVMVVGHNPNMSNSCR